MAWNAGTLILDTDGAIGTRISNTFTPTNPGGGNELRVKPLYTNPAKVQNPDSHLVMRMETQDEDGSWRQQTVTTFQGGPSATDTPYLGVSPDRYGVLHRVTLESETASNVGLYLQAGFED